MAAPIEITFVRHGESVSNVVGRWQGQGDAALSDDGRRQAERLASRLSDEPFDRVIASDLRRAADTARALGRDLEQDPAWREIDVGAWEGLTREEVATRFPREIDALRRGEPIAIGGGESWGDLERRIDAALARLRASLAPGSRAIVVTHGGVIHTVMSGLLGLRDRRPRPIGRVMNTAITTVRFDGDVVELVRYNDACHARGLGSPGWDDDVPHRTWGAVSLIAHDDGHASGVHRDAGWPEQVEHVYCTRGEPIATLAKKIAERAAPLPEPLVAPSDLERAVPDLAMRHARARVAIVASARDVASFAEATLSRRDGRLRVAPPHHGAAATALVTDVTTTLVDYNVG